MNNKQRNKFTFSLVNIKLGVIFFCTNKSIFEIFLCVQCIFYNYTGTLCENLLTNIININIGEFISRINELLRFIILGMFFAVDVFTVMSYSRGGSSNVALQH